jgi:hypothetical protein
MINILLITNKGDITTDFIVKRLTELNVNFYRLNTEDLFSKVSINFNFQKNEFNLLDSEKLIKIDLQKIKSVYYRRPILPNINQSNLSQGEHKFIISEINNCLEGLYKILKFAFWISPVYSIREAESKIYQLQVATALGFAIPSSLITNEPQVAKIFTEDYKSIVKPIKNGLIEDEDKDKIIFTSLLNNSSDLNRIESCPTYFQEFISKVADIRVTVIGNKTFPALISSQEYDVTKVDWRKAEKIKLKYEKIELPIEINELCIKLTKKLGLNFGAIDFVKDKFDNYYFLEINPNGQWAWIEKQLNYKLSHEISNLLINEKN